MHSANTITVRLALPLLVLMLAAVAHPGAILDTRPTTEIKYVALDILLRLHTGTEWREKEQDDRAKELAGEDPSRYERFEGRMEVESEDIKAAKRADRSLPGPSRGISAVRRLRQLNGGIIVQSNVHREACVGNPACGNTQGLKYGSPANYEVGKILGRGHYGTAYLGRRVGDTEHLVAKVMNPIAATRLEREVAVLRAVNGGPNIMEFFEIVEDSGDGSHAKAFIYEFVNGTIDYHEDFPSLSLDDVRRYLYQALQALAFAHSKGVIHRDVKPSNMLIDHVAKKLRVIDWGLSDFYFPGKEYSTRVSTRYYKAPELLFALNDYDYAVDMWSLGCVMGHMILNEGVLFAGRSYTQQITNTARIVGSESIRRYLRTYGLSTNTTFDDTLGDYPAKDFREFIGPHNAHKMTPDAIDLLQRFLTIDHQERISAADALSHPFFVSER